MGRLNKRIGRLEDGLLPKQSWPVFILTYGRRHGKDGKMTRDETNEQAIARHLAEYPEDEGRELGIITIVAVTPDMVEAAV